LTSFETNQKGKEASRLEFITPSEETQGMKEVLEPKQEKLQKTEMEESIITSSWETYHYPPFEENEEVFAGNHFKKLYVESNSLE